MQQITVSEPSTIPPWRGRNYIALGIRQLALDCEVGFPTDDVHVCGAVQRNAEVIRVPGWVYVPARRGVVIRGVNIKGQGIVNGIARIFNAKCIDCVGAVGIPSVRGDLYVVCSGVEAFPDQEPPRLAWEISVIVGSDQPAGVVEKFTHGVGEPAAAQDYIGSFCQHQLEVVCIIARDDYADGPAVQTEVRRVGN